MTTNIVGPREPSLDLAEIEPFALGNATVDPGHRRIRWNGESSEELEPRVMKVLVALAQAEGHVVSRDRLVHLCWDDRIVGDDAINRCIQAIRRIAKRIEPAAFRIETTARVGYTLVVEWTEADPNPVAKSLSSSSTSGPARPVMLLSIGAVTLVLASAAAILPKDGESAMTRIAITADRASDVTLASDLKVDLNEFAGGTLTDVSLVDSPRRADLVVRISTSGDGQAARGNVALMDGRRRDMLWSATADSMTGEESALRGQIAAKLGNLFACAAKMDGAEGKGLDTGAKRLFLAACTNMDDVADQHDVEMLRKLTARAPRFAAGWSYLALAEAELLTTAEQLDSGTSGERDSLRRLAVADLRRAQALDSNLGTNFAAAAALVPASDWAARLKTLENGIARDPDEYLVHNSESAALGAVGLSDQAVTAAQRAAELKPFSVDARTMLIWALVHNREFARARAELGRAEKLWPDADQLVSVRFSIELRYGDARVAKRMIDAGRMSYISGCGQDLMMLARLAPTQSNIAKLIHYATVETRKLPSVTPQRLLALAQFDATDEAYSVLAQPGAMSTLRTTSEILFRPQFASFRQDPRFPRLAVRLGLLQFWRDSGRWPDFCSDPGLAYDCKAEAARLLGGVSVAGRSRTVPAEATAA